MNPSRARIAAVVLATALAAVALAACGSSTSTTSGPAAAAASGSGTSTAGQGPNSAARAKLAACLKQHGITLPQRRSGNRSQGGRSGPPPGGGGYGGGPGFFGGGGGARGAFSNPKTRAAVQACAKAAGLNFRPGQGRTLRPSTSAIAAFAACVKQHGYTLPKANTSGKGPVYPRSIQSNKKFQTAARACQSLLRPSGGAPPPGGAPSTTTSSTTKT